MGKDNAVYFLLVYSFDEGRLVHQEEQIDRNSAIAAYDAMERHYRACLDRYEVVLIGADSIQTVMKTHGHYFRRSDDSMFSEFLSDPQAV
ncbi:hypothetical protein NGTWS0302_17820 [Mycolicibacterium cyprinidarum]|uniref:Uncharacterized protein n=1 Tax=Mycolicibacterium cyprinidarum TaxID=2860311 RepID=A0ABQ4V9U4_9MYCO|nr:hypothetical protein NGTWS1702_12530 [Mycolicibacterium sp. NGTWSNA01]GJF19135.1 hypothetical protein NGTWS0302_17820 [Mycolicibacterium sp. NGTWS0302]GJF19764.1 hypothetical protein NGTWS1803_09820 [Mycolicibacterium sp. NGTWS1803]